MVTGSAVEPPVTEHSTRDCRATAVADPLHWVTVAPVVLATGAQTTVGWVPPPPVPDPMHSFTVAPGVDVPMVTLLVKVTLQTTLLPPPVTIPLHWLIEVTS